MNLVHRRFAAFAIATGLLFGANLVSAKAGPHKKEILSHNRQLVERYFNEVWNQGKVDVLNELLSSDYKNFTPSTPNPPLGPDGLKPIVLAIRKGFPDLHYTIKDIVVTENAVAVRVVMEGTNTGELFGNKPTGKKVSVNQIQIETIRDGKIVEHWRVTDELEMKRQLEASGR